LEQEKGLNMRSSSARLLLFVSMAVSAPAVAIADETVWTKDTTGAARHVQSGFACPSTLVTTRSNRSSLATIGLENVIVGAGAAQGDAVACEYGWTGGSWVTVEIVRLRPGESADTHEAATRQHIARLFPNAQGSSAQMRVRVSSPTGGSTYSMAYQNAAVGEQRGSVAAVGGDIGGWMVKVVQFDFDRDAGAMKFVASKNWEKVANSRR
jgi:hypothetical protein